MTRFKIGTLCNARLETAERQKTSKAVMGIEKSGLKDNALKLKPKRPSFSRSMNIGWIRYIPKVTWEPNVINAVIFGFNLNSKVRA